MKYSVTAVKKMTGAIHVYIITAPVIVSILLMIITNNVIPSNCFKTMDTVHKLSKHPQLVSYNKVPLLWKPESASKSLATSAALPTSSDYCQPSSSKAISSKCRREQTVRKLKSQENRKRWKTRSKIYEKMNLISALPESPRSLMNLKKLTPDSIHEINTFIKKKRRYCKLHDFNGFPCKKLKFVTWLAKKMENDTTEITPWLEFVKKSENETVGRSLSSKDLSSIKPDYWLEKVVYRLIKSWGDPDDLFTFYKYKDFIKSRELKISLPYEVVLKISPQSSKEHEKKEETSIGRSSNSVGSARIFWDPGFNLKLKLPFFRDELKVAVSTGPAFIAGIGVGIAVLIVKSMFAPFLFGLKWMAYNLFFKESSPFDLMKMLFNMGSSDPWDSPMPPPSIDHYRPPPVHNHFDRRPPGRPPRPFGPPPPRHRPFHGPPGPPGPPPPYHHPPFDHHGFPPQMLSAPTAPGPSGIEHEHEFQSHPSAPPFDLNHQFTQPTPMIQTLSGSSPTMSQLEELYRNQLLEEGLGMKQPTYKSMLQPEPTNTIDMTGGGIESYDGAQETDHRDDQSYTPSTGLQAEVEHYDPFYSPLLSKIDLIFTYLGHTDEGCRERVVCSIYKFPVKYAPHSNLLSAQLSKHQTELKRPVTSSGKILRYFRYMKAAKDGQGGENCLDLYPKCNSDTDAVSSLPMIATFNQLSELMTAEASSPGVSLAAAG